MTLFQPPMADEVCEGVLVWNAKGVQVRNTPTVQPFQDIRPKFKRLLGLFPVDLQGRDPHPQRGRGRRTLQGHQGVN